MTILYWISAVVLSVFGAAVTASVVSLMMNSVLQASLDNASRRLWDWGVGILITLTYIALPFYIHSDDIDANTIRSWNEMGNILERLVKMEVRWFLYIAGFWFVVVLFVHMGRKP